MADGWGGTDLLGRATGEAGALVDSAAHEIDALKTFVASTVGDLKKAISDHLDFMEARYRLANQEIPAAVAADIAAVKSAATGAVDSFNKEALVKVAALAAQISGAAGATISATTGAANLKTTITAGALELEKTIGDALAALEEKLLGFGKTVLWIVGGAAALLLLVPLLSSGDSR